MTITTNRRSDSLETRIGSAFGLAGVLILASLVVPVGLELFTDQAWAAGLALVGLAVVSISAGMRELYFHVESRAPHIALAGLGAAAVAGLAAVGLIALVSIALVGQTIGATLGEPIGVFVALSLSMAGGLALGLILFGIASWKAETPSRTVAGLLMGGGLVLLTPVGIETVALAVGVGTPAWLLFPVIGLIALDAVVIGYLLRFRKFGEALDRPYTVSNE